MEDLFLRLYRGCCLETRSSRSARQKTAALLAEAAEWMGREKADELQMSTSITCEEEGLRSFMEGFRLGMTAVSEAL